MKVAPLIALGWSALVAAVPSTPAQAQSPYAGPVWVTSKDAEVLIAELEDRMGLDRLMEPPGDSALDILRALRDQKTNRPEVQELTRKLFDRMLRKGRAAMRAKAFDRSAQWLRAAREVGANLNDPELAAAESELSTLRKQADVTYIPQ